METIELFTTKGKVEILFPKGVDHNTERWLVQNIEVLEEESRQAQMDWDTQN
jgi:hypothetical protein